MILKGGWICMSNMTAPLRRACKCFSVSACRYRTVWWSQVLCVMEGKLSSPCWPKAHELHSQPPVSAVPSEAIPFQPNDSFEPVGPTYIENRDILCIPFAILGENKSSQKNSKLLSTRKFLQQNTNYIFVRTINNYLWAKFQLSIINRKLTVFRQHKWSICVHRIPTTQWLALCPRNLPSTSRSVQLE